jgi:hypothetical protein
MSSDDASDDLLDGIAELMLLPIRAGQSRKVEAEIILEADKHGQVKLRCQISSPKETTNRAKKRGR